jgi:tRNA(fMet)-specific endonuclease VapC
LQNDRHAVSKIELAAEVFIPAIAVGELLFGAAKSRRPAENSAVVERFASSRSILPCDFSVARVYGRVKQRLREKGRPIPENDLWIAATAACHELVLVTRDQHFNDVDGLTVTVLVIADLSGDSRMAFVGSCANMLLCALLSICPIRCSGS